MSKPFVFDLAVVNETTFFAATNIGLLKTTDRGTTWQNQFEVLALPQSVAATAVTISPNYEDDKTLFTASEGAILRSHDAGNSWHAVQLPDPPPTVSALITSPTYSQDRKVWAATAEDGVFLSNDGGQNWTAWNFGLYDTRINDLVISPQFAQDKTLWAGTESDVFCSTNEGRAWEPLNLPIEAQSIVSLSSTATALLAATSLPSIYSKNTTSESTWQEGPNLSGQKTLQLLAGDNGQHWILTDRAIWRGHENTPPSVIVNCEATTMAVIDSTTLLVDQTVISCL